MRLREKVAAAAGAATVFGAAASWALEGVAARTGLPPMPLTLGGTFVAALVGALAAARVVGSLEEGARELARRTRSLLERDGPESRRDRPPAPPELAELSDALDATLADVAQLKQRLTTTERIAARREVARKVAHEIKNPLAPIRAAVETLRRLRARDDPAFDDYFDEATRTVLDEVRRITTIVTEFTQFSRLPAPSLARLDLGELATHVATLHQSSVDGKTARRGPGGARLPRVEVSIEPVPPVLADRDQLVQVLTNLVQNGLEAASATRDDARVLLSVAPAASASPDETGAPPPGAPVRHARLVVRDNGPGVPEEQRARLFEPYATTKKSGTGLGLAIAQRIVFEHGGDLRYRTATKGGAVFEIVLPIDGPTLLEKAPEHTQTHRAKDL